MELRFWKALEVRGLGFSVRGLGGQGNGDVPKRRFPRKSPLEDSVESMDQSLEVLEAFGNVEAPRHVRQALGGHGNAETPSQALGGSARVLSSASRRELKWWRKHAGNWIPLRLEEVAQSRIANFHSDASGYAYGSTNGVWGLWKIEEQFWNIAVKELEAVRRLVCSLPKGTKAKIGCDNMAAFWVLKRGRAFSWDLNNLVRRLGGDVFARGLDLEFYWVASKDNLADGPSRAWTEKQALEALSSVRASLPLF